MDNFTGQFTRALYRHHRLLVTVALLLVVLPFVALSCYNHPSLDDILDATTVKTLGFWAAQKFFYLTLTGRYTTTILLALVNPLLYHHLEASWWAVATAFIFGTLLVLWLCLTRLLGLSGSAAWRVAGTLLGLWLTYAPGQAEGLYWFTGAYTYVATAWLLLLWLLALNHYQQARRAGHHSWGRLMVLAGLTLAVAGTTEPMALPFLLALLLGAGLSWWSGRGRILRLLAALAAAGSAVSFAAPGNFVRMASMGASFGVLKTLSYSAATTGYLLLTWVGNPVLLAISALLLPALYRVAQKRDQLLTILLARVPTALLAGVLVLLLAAANCPAYYASGTGLPLRARTMLHLLFIVGWFGVLLAWCCRQVGREQLSPLLEQLVAGRLALLWTGLLVLFFFTDYNVQTRATMLGQGSNNVVRAYRQWLGGEAKRYDDEMRTRYAALGSSALVVQIQPLRHRPDLLCSFDIADPGNAQVLHLQGYATYFGKKRVVVKATP